MAGGRELADAPKTRSTANETGNKLHWEREGNKAKLTAGKNGVDGGSEKTGDADGGPWSFSVRRLRPRARAKMERGAREGVTP